MSISRTRAFSVDSADLLRTDRALVGETECHRNLFGMFECGVAGRREG